MKLGVRKLKEILFEIITEINLEILQSVQLDIPYILTEDLIKNKYLKERNEVIHKLFTKFLQLVLLMDYGLIL